MPRTTTPTRRNLIAAATLSATAAVIAAPVATPSALAQTPALPPTSEPRPAMTANVTQRSVTVSASGTTDAVPDMAHISTGVTTEAATARDAITQNNAVMAKLIDGIKQAGIAATDIKTTTINVNPRYTNNRDGRPPVISGYQASNNVRLAVRDLKKLGDLLDLTIRLGANQMGGISFEVSKAETLKDEARKSAMVNARRRAELYAAAAGASLGEVITISETITMAGPRPMPMNARAAMQESVSIEPGETQLQATVHVTWALK